MANRKGTNRPVEKARLVLEKEQFYRNSLRG